MSWSRFFRRRAWDDERARELAGYLAQETDDNIARGMRPDEARAAAYRRLGNPTLVREEIYRMNTVAILDALWRDLSYGGRILRRNPAFALITIASLAIGIGANAAIFQLLDAIQFRTLPVRDPQALVEVVRSTSNRWGNTTGSRAVLTNALWEQVRDRQHAFSGVLAWGRRRFDLSTGGESRFVDGLWLSGSTFDVLGVRPQLGRLLVPADDVRGCGARLAVISYPFWQREYGGDPSIVGRTIHLDGHPLDIIGVTPAAFYGLEVGQSFDVAVPICAEPALEPERNAVGKAHYWWLDVVGRLRPGASLETARADLQAISGPAMQAAVAPQFPPADAKTFLTATFVPQTAATGVSPLRTAYERPLWILLTIAGLVLLIACANLASLMLARATARDKEIAVRLAIGASRGRIIRQLLAESVLIAVIGAGFGILVAQTLSRLLVAYMSAGTNRLFFDMQMDWRVLLFTSVLAAAACLLFGLTPALRATRQRSGTGLRVAGRGVIEGGARFGMRGLLVVTQVAISLVLLVCGALFVRTTHNLANVDPGFRTRGVLIADFDPHLANIIPTAQPAFERALRERIAALPGVEAVADADIEPLSGSVWNDRIIVGGVPQQTISNENHISPGFFRLFDMPIVAGRDFSEGDLPGATDVAIVNETFARKLLNTEQPLGRTFKMEVSPGEADPTYQVVGVVRDTKYRDVRESPGPVVYFPEAQIPDPDRRLTEVQTFIRSSLPLSSVSPTVTANVRDFSPSTLVTYRDFRTDIEDSFLRERVMATLSGFFAALAALLAMIGLYGVMSYMVTRRRAEIGVRLALGAEARGVFALILREAVLLLAVGIAAGGVLTFGATRFVDSLLYNVKPWDLATVAGAILSLAAIGCAASWWPARRATRIPMSVALRQE